MKISALESRCGLLGRDAEQHTDTVAQQLQESLNALSFRVIEQSGRYDSALRVRCSFVLEFI